jgi:hypothetical protein
MFLDFTDIIEESAKKEMTAKDLAKAFVDKVNKSENIPVFARVDKKDDCHIHFDYCFPSIEASRIDSLKLS